MIYFNKTTGTTSIAVGPGWGLEVPGRAAAVLLHFK